VVLSAWGALGCLVVLLVLVGRTETVPQCLVVLLVGRRETVPQCLMRQVHMVALPAPEDVCPLPCGQLDALTRLRLDDVRRYVDDVRRYVDDVCEYVDEAYPSR